MWLLIDDMRDGMGCDVIARNSEAAINLLLLVDWEGVVFDNDLGQSSKEGYQIMEKMFEYGIFPKYIDLVTSNPVARQRMQSTLEDHGYLNEGDGRKFTYSIT